MWERVGTKSLIGFLILLLTLALASVFNVQLARSNFAAESEDTVVRVIPEDVELGGDIVGETFDIAVVIENVGNLSGLDIVLEWNTTYLQHVTHIRTAPVEHFPTPQPPSPYPGIIHAPLISLPEPDPQEGHYTTAFATLGGPSFNGSGTVFIMTFQVHRQPQPQEEDVTLSLSLPSTILARSTAAGGGAIPHDAVNGTIVLHKLSICELHVTSSPPTSVPFTIDGELRVTPYTDWLLQGSYALEMPETHNEYNWSHWQEDGDPNRIKTIELDSNARWTAIYKHAGPPPPSPPIGGFSVPIESHFSSWLASTLLIVALFFASSIYHRRKHV